WLSETTRAIAVHRRLGTAVASWEQLERSRDALWRERQLADLAIVPDGELSPSEAAFVAASRRAARRRRALRVGAAIAIPVVIAAIYGGAQLVARRDIAHRVADNVGDANRELHRARQSSADSARLQTEAYTWFDAGDSPSGEAAWDAA